MASALCRSLFRSARIARSLPKLASKRTDCQNSHLFNINTNTSVNSAASRSWLIRKSYPLQFNIHSRNFSTFFAPREEQKTGSCCHAKHDSASPQQTAQSSIPNINKHNFEHIHEHKPPSATDLSFWKDNSVWRRASSNTLRCLIGCSIGDFSAMFYLQTHHTGLPFLAMMTIPMASGIATSLGFETLVLRIKESMSWGQSLKTAWTMSLISMLTMEFVENIVDMYLTKGMMNFHDPYFWLALVPSLLAGFLAPLPYNYYKLKKFGKSCH